MFEAITRYLAQIEEEASLTGDPKLSEADVAEAIVAILKHVVLADGAVKAEEVEAVTRIFKEGYPDANTQYPQMASQLDPERMLEFDGKSLFSIAFVLRRAMSRDQLERLRGNLIEVAKSDGVFHPFEEELIALFDELTSSPLLDDTGRQER